MEFPNLYTGNFKDEKFKMVKEALDFAVSQYENGGKEREVMLKNYNSYNGIVDPKSYESLVKPFGTVSKTKYIHYNFGLNKVKTLVGEFLGAPIDPRVETIDDEHVNKKFNKYLERRAMVDMKDQIATAKNAGYDLFPGMLEQMENEDDFLSPKNFMTENEQILTKYLKDKIKKNKLKLKFKKNMIDLINSNRMFGKVETINGIDEFRAISPMLRMGLDSDSEGFNEDDPYIGEKRYLFMHQVVKEFDITDKTELDEIKEWQQNPGTYFKEGMYELRNNALLIPVYTIEFKTVAFNTFFKIDHTSDVPYIREIDEKQYKQIVATNNPMIEAKKLYLEEVWEATRIGVGIYKNIRRVTRQANTVANKKLYARYNYVSFLAENTNGITTPIQTVISKLDKTYNDVMFLINKELRKPSGSVVGINMGYLPDKTGYNKVMDEMSEDGVIRYNTAAEGNKYGLEGRSEQAISAVNIGDRGRAIDILLRLKMDIEDATDKITGITRGRSGAEMATTTATTSNNNLETSRTVTYDIFYNAKEFFDEVMTRLVEKGKLNFIEHNPQISGGLFSDEEFSFMLATSEIALEHFSAYINDGRKESIIRQKIEGLFQGEINSGALRSKDVAKFYLQESLDNGLQVLDKAWKEINQMQSQNSQQTEEAKLQAQQQQLAIEEQAREDIQAHEMDIVNRQGEIDADNIKLENQFKAINDSNSNFVKESIANKKIASDQRKQTLDAQNKDKELTIKQSEPKTPKTKTKK